MAIGKKRVDFHRTFQRNRGEELAMTEQDPNPPATVPAQREAVGPVKKSTPVIIALVVIVGLIGLANISSLVSGKKRTAPAECAADAPGDRESSAGLQLRETQQATEAKREFRGSAAATGASPPRCSNFRPRRMCQGRRQQEHRP